MDAPSALLPVGSPPSPVRPSILRRLLRRGPSRVPARPGLPLPATRPPLLHQRERHHLLILGLPVPRWVLLLCHCLAHTGHFACAPCSTCVRPCRRTTLQSAWCSSACLPCPLGPAAVGGGPVRYRWALGTTRWGRDVLDWQDLSGSNSTQNVSVRRCSARLSVFSRCHAAWLPCAGCLQERQCGTVLAELPPRGSIADCASGCLPRLLPCRRRLAALL